MNIYNYTKDTKEFIGQSIATPNPKSEGDFLIPANATTHIVPAINANECAVFNVALDFWEVVPDFRGQVFYVKTTGDEIEHVLGETPSADVQETFPASVQATIDAQAAADNLANAESSRVQAIKSEGLSRIGAIVPALNSFEMIDFAVELFKSIDSKTLTPEFVAAKQIRITVKTAIQNGTALAAIVWPV